MLFIVEMIKATKIPIKIAYSILSYSFNREVHDNYIKKLI